MSKIKPSQPKPSGRVTADSIYHLFEWLITALASTLVFIIFMMQVYRIPTGSMADTLKGAHFRLRCEQCGYAYDYDFSPRSYKLAETVVPSRDLPVLKEACCPSCGYRYRTGMRTSDPRHAREVFKGDQIFVIKCIYQFFEPNRWDVIVFKNPLEPRINYIKRLVGKPGEKVEIIDGDIYINNRIMRKPPDVQEELWMPIYDNDYIPARPAEPRFGQGSWSQPFVNVGTSRWDPSGSGSTVFTLNESGRGVHRIQYNPSSGNDFRAIHAYDPPEFIPYMPICSDLMIRCYPKPIAAESALGAELGKYGRRYEGWIHANGQMMIRRIETGKEPVLLASGSFATEPDDEGMREFRFANVDHQLILEYGSARLVHDLGRGSGDAGTNRTIYPEAAILGYGRLELHHIALFRDLHYLSTDATNPQRPILRGGPDDPIVLGEGEYFVCGDNSPFSSDSRWWEKPGTGNKGRTFPAGVVPREYLVGKAFFVHWPGGYRVMKKFFRFIPYVEGMKVIVGGQAGWDRSEAGPDTETERHP